MGPLQQATRTVPIVFVQAPIRSAPVSSKIWRGRAATPADLAAAGYVDCPLVVNVRTLHLPTDLAGDRQALPVDPRRARAEHPVPLQHLPPTTIDAVIEREGRRELVPMRWGLTIRLLVKVASH